MATTVDRLSTVALADITGVHPATLNRWTHDGVLRIIRGGGSGSPFLYPASEVEVARVLGQWRDVVNDPDTVHAVARAARTQRGEAPRCIVVVPINDAVMVTFGWEVS